MKKVLIFALLLFSATGYAQKYQWASLLQPTSGSSFKHLIDICNDGKEHLYVLGEMENSLTNGVDSIENPGATSCYVAKYKTDGTPLWIIPLGSKSYEIALSIAYANNSIYVAGFFQGSEIVAGDQTVKRGSNTNYIFQFDTNGKYVKHKSVVQRLKIHDIEPVGDFLFVANYSDLLVLDKDLNQVSSTPFRGKGYTIVQDIKNVNDTAYLVSGYYSNLLTINEIDYPNSTSGNGATAFIALYNLKTNELRWLKHFGKLPTSYRFSMDYLPEANRVYVASNVIATVQFEDEILKPINNRYHSVLAGYNMDGSMAFANMFYPLGNSGDALLDKVFGMGENVLVAGSALNSYGLTYENDTLHRLTSHKNNVTFSALYKLDKNGNVGWSNAAGGRAGSNEFWGGTSIGDQLYVIGFDASGKEAKYGCYQYTDRAASYVFNISDEAPNYNPDIDFSIEANDKTLTLKGLIDSQTKFRWSINGIPFDSTKIQTEYKVGDYGEVEICLYAQNECGESTKCKTFTVIQYSEIPIVAALGYAGGDVSGLGGSISYTGGLPAYVSHGNTGGRIDEGIQRPYELVIVSNVEDARIHLDIKAYPNPTQDILYLNIYKELTAPLTVKIFSLKGDLLYQQKVSESTTALSMESYAKGTYVLQVVQNSQTISSYKIIKQ